jgi:hypothetical protein
MRYLFLVAALLVGPIAHARNCGRVPSPTEITFECGSNGAYLQMTTVVKALNEKRKTERYRLTQHIGLWLHGSVTIPTDEAAFLDWVAGQGLGVVRYSHVIILKL